MIPFALNLHDTEPLVINNLLNMLDDRGYLCLKPQQSYHHLLLVNEKKNKTYVFADTYQMLDKSYLLKLPRDFDELFDRINIGHDFKLIEK